MTSALVYKELREILGVAVLGLVTLVLIALTNMGYSPVPGMLGNTGYGAIPFLHDSFGYPFAWAAAGLATALGLWQSLSDFRGEAQLFLLHRPVSRRTVYATKLAVGLTTYLLCALAAILLHSGWAATPGTHASPFFWSMTAYIWWAWLAMIIVYLGAFLSGIRPAAWIGTRLAPLAAAALTVVLIMSGPVSVQAFLFVAAGIILAVSILAVCESRDFA